MADKEILASSVAKDGDETDEVAVPKSNYVLKMDLRLIPILGCTYTILFLDRTNSGWHAHQPRLSSH